MLFRIEDINNYDGNHRTYNIPTGELQKIDNNIEYYIANEIRKEINNSKSRRLLSYSKSLGICMLKYNIFGDNELHITDAPIDTIMFLHKKDDMIIPYPFTLSDNFLDDINLDYDLYLYNFIVDVSDNQALDNYLRKTTGKGRKIFASPEKDYEVVMYQSYINDIIISSWLPSIYLLFSLALKYGFPDFVSSEIYNKVVNLPDYRFESNYGINEREGILLIIEYLSEKLAFEKEIIENLLKTLKNLDNISFGFSSMDQFLRILTDKDYDYDEIVSDEFHYHYTAVSEIITNAYINYFNYVNYYRFFNF